AAFRRYLDALLAAYREPAGTAGELRARAALTQAQNEIWSRTITASLDPNGEKARVLIIPTVNEMFDSVDRERLAQRLHPPFAIYVMLVITTLAASLFAGYALASAPHRNWIYIVGVAATISIATYVILELESPRLGWIRVDSMNQALAELRATMK
ncbi:MAG TPA: hypothetical protein VK864_05395, partial [Longimicrobiales bacterium]|nr:hypothetical protein [Longimicrobiales bacterium]